MTSKQALKIAQKIAAEGNRADVSIHKGEGTARAIRIHGTYPETAREVGRDLMFALETAGVYGKPVYAPGFVAVWF